MRTRPRSRLTAALVAMGMLASSNGAAADGGLSKGPWLMDLRADSVTIMAERAEPGSLTVRAWPAASGDGGVRTVTASDRTRTTLHEVRLGSLVPGVRYQYEVRGPGVSPVGGSFTAPPGADAPFRFVLYGDTRSGQATHEAAVAAIHREAPDFVVHTGDLMADGRNERQWQTFFDIESVLLRDAPFVPVIGNHEISRRESNGVENFRRYVHADPSSPSPELDYTFAYGSVRFVLVNAFDDWEQPDRLAWLDAALAHARAEVPDGFVIAVMHQGVCSCGPHGENQVMRRAGVDEMFRRRGVDLVVSGHDHLYERGDDHGLRYLVTGGCGAPLYARRHYRDYTMSYSAEHHYVRADVEPGVITLTATRLDGTVIEQCRLRHSGWDCPRPLDSTTTTNGSGADAANETVAGDAQSGAARPTLAARASGCSCTVVGPASARTRLAAVAGVLAAMSAFARRRQKLERTCTHPRTAAGE